MTVSYLHYDLHDGYIHNWLVAGPQAIAVSNAPRCRDEKGRLQIASEHAMEASGITKMPVERGPLSEGTFKIGDFEGAWSYLCCLEDHFVDLSAIYPTCQYLRAFAYAQIELPAAQMVTLEFTTYGPVDVWLDDEHVYRHAEYQRRPQTVAFEASLPAGRTALLVRFEQVGVGATSHAIALRVAGLTPEVAESAAVILPTTIEPLERRNAFEKILVAARLNQTVYSADDEIKVMWEGSESWKMPLALMLQKIPGRLYAEAQVGEKPDKGATLGHAFQYPEGFYHALVMPIPEEYYEENMRIARMLPLWALDNNRYSDALYGTFPDRRAEALTHAAKYPDDVWAQLARMAIAWWSRVENDVILQAVEDVNAREDGCVSDLLGLLSMVIQFGDAEAFPEALQAPLESAILHFRYRQDEPGDDTMDFLSEPQQLMFHTCEILAGRYYADRTFTNSGETGAEHQAQGQALALAWLRERAARGFAAWGSDIAFEQMLAALAHLVAYVEDDDVWEMAVVIMDKMLYTLAINSYKGVFGAAHSLTETGSVLNGMLGATSGISRLMWGMGAFNSHTLGTTSLATMESYEFPRLIQAIATDVAEPVWNREQHAPQTFTDGANLATYTTPDFMLSSVQDYRPGQPGDREHIWQATLGPAAMTFVNHPACRSVDEARQPNFWRGNAVLPRVAQWKDVLIAIYNLPDDDWMGFTHAYFPTYAFDAYTVHDGWAFAQKGDGYLALTASQDIHLTETGQHAQRELRAYGQHTAWLCHMGRAALNGTFEGFQAAILALDVNFEGLSVKVTTLRDERLAFGWEGALLRNEQEEPITGFKHYDSTYGFAELDGEDMVIVLRGQAMRLRLGNVPETRDEGES